VVDALAEFRVDKPRHIVDGGRKIDVCDDLVAIVVIVEDRYFGKSSMRVGPGPIVDDRRQQLVAVHLVLSRSSRLKIAASETFIGLIKLITDFGSGLWEKSHPLWMLGGSCLLAHPIAHMVLRKGVSCGLYAPMAISRASACCR
jgi:hypothetical protein